MNILEIIKVITPIIISIIAIIMSSHFSNKSLKESYRADIVFHITQPQEGSVLHQINFENFGNRAGIIVDIKINPELEFINSDGSKNLDFQEFFNCKNLLVAPNQKFSTVCNLKKYIQDGIEFEVTIKYKSIDSSKIKTVKYKLPLKYTKGIFHIETIE